MTNPRPVDPRAGILCTSCNTGKRHDAKPHCDTKTCPWWKCHKCGASNDATGANDLTYRDGSAREQKKAS